MSSSPRSSLTYEGYKLEDLPYDIAYQYMLSLGPRDLQNLCRMNRKFKHFCDQEDFWIKKLSMDFPEAMEHQDLYKNPKKLWIELTVSARCDFFLLTKLDFKNLGSTLNRYKVQFEKYQHNPENDRIVIKFFEKLYEEGFAFNLKFHHRLAFRSEVSEKLQHFERKPYIFLKGNRLVMYIRLKKTDEGKYQPFNEKEKQVCTETMEDLFDDVLFEKEYSKEFDKNFDYKYILYDRDENFVSKYKTKPNVQKGETLFEVKRTLDNIGKTPLRSEFNQYEMPKEIY